MTITVDPVEHPPAPAKVETSTPAITRIEPVDLNQASIITFRAAMAWACDLGYRDAVTAAPKRSVLQVMSAYPFAGQVGHENALHAAYQAGRWHHDFAVARQQGTRTETVGDVRRDVRVVKNPSPLAPHIDTIPNVVPSLPDPAAAPTLTQTINPATVPLGRPQNRR